MTTTTTSADISLVGVSKTYQMGNSTVLALHDVDLRTGPGN